MKPKEYKERLKDAKDYGRITRMVIDRGQYREFSCVVVGITPKQIIVSKGIRRGITARRFGQFNQTGLDRSYVTLTTPSFLQKDRLMFLVRAIKAKAIPIRDALQLMKGLS